MPWRLKYPEASTKTNHYRNLVSTLALSKSAISYNVERARTVDAVSLDPQNVDGEYYTRYITKRDAWIAIHSQKIAMFDTFLTNLDGCITSARNYEALWQGRIGVMEEYI